MVTAAWPLVGRQEELDLVAETMESAAFRGVVLAGATGVGKSRLACEALAAARERGWTTLDAVATRAAASIPFGALAPLLPPPLGRVADRLEVLRQARQSLVQHAEGGRLAVLVDDAHLLDDGSAALVHQLAATAAAFILVTLRSGEASPDPIVALWKDGVGRRIEVRPLSHAEVRDLVEQVLGGHVDGASLQEIARVTDGNVLFLRELVHSGITAGILAFCEGIWRWRGPMAPSGALLAVIEERLRGLDARQTRLLEAVALGEPVGAEVMRTLAEPATVADTEAAGMLAVGREGRRTYVRLAHPLYAEVVRARAGALHLPEVLTGLADALQATGARRQEDLLRIATWRLDAGERPSPQLLEAAAARALAVGDFPLAERLARAGVEAGGGFDVGCLLAQSLMHQHRADEVEAALAALVPGTDDEVVRVALLRTTNLFWSMARPAEVDAVIRQAEEVVGDTARRDELAAMRAVSLYCLGRPADALAQASAILERPSAGGQSLILAHTVSAASFAFMGRCGCALAAVDRGLAALRDLPAMQLPDAGQLRLIRWIALWLAGRLETADALAQAGYHRSLAARTGHTTGRYAFQLGLGALARGRPATAMDWLQEAVLLCRDGDPSRLLVASLGSLAQAAALTGDFAKADAALVETLEAMPSEQAWLTICRAWVTALGRDLAAGCHLALEAADLAATQGFTALEGLALHTVVRLGEPGAVAGRLAMLEGRTDGILVPTMAAHATALTRGDGEALDGVAARFESAGSVLCAAEVAADAARAHHQSGRLALARAAHARALAMLARCEGARTPALTSGVVPEALTCREQEVAQLAASGLPSRDIATRLGVSVRTVDNHLQRVYSKLELRNRRELAAVFRL
jgi:DNA-binding CsgD family transcriptional regulator